MLERTPRPATLLAGVALVTVAAGTQVVAQAATVAPHQAAVGSTTAPAAERSAPYRWATIDRTKRGYLYTAGLQDSHLVVTRSGGRLRFVDSGTARWDRLPGACRKEKARGIAATCRIPASRSERHPLKLKIVPRLGDDVIEASSLSAAFNLRVLADAGRDVVHTGAGDDFVNGAQNRDRVRGGAGNDWIRTGIGNDSIRGGSGRDRLVGVDGEETIRGGKGNDRIGGGSGHDRLYAGRGRDHLLCGSGRDSARADRGDRVSRDCERVKRG